MSELERLRRLGRDADQTPQGPNAKHCQEESLVEVAFEVNGIRFDRHIQPISVQCRCADCERKVEETGKQGVWRPAMEFEVYRVEGHRDMVIPYWPKHRALPNTQEYLDIREHERKLRKILGRYTTNRENDQFDYLTGTLGLRRCLECKSEGPTVTGGWLEIKEFPAVGAGAGFARSRMCWAHREQARKEAQAKKQRYSRSRAMRRRMEEDVREVDGVRQRYCCICKRWYGTETAFINDSGSVAPVCVEHYGPGKSRGSLRSYARANEYVAYRPGMCVDPVSRYCDVCFTWKPIQQFTKVGNGYPHYCKVCEGSFTLAEGRGKTGPRLRGMEKRIMHIHEEKRVREVRSCPACETMEEIEVEEGKAKRFWMNAERFPIRQGIRAPYCKKHDEMNENLERLGDYTLLYINRMLDGEING